MANEVSIWNKLMSSAMTVPGVKVDRESFLRKEFSLYCSAEQLDKVISIRPSEVLSKNIIDRVANSCINSHTTKVTALSTLAGIPGGFPDLRDENGDLSDSACDMLTIFVGVMMGVAQANMAIRMLSEKFAKEVIKRLPRMALTKTAIYPLIKQIAKWIGISLTKSSFAKALGKVIPIVGGAISGGLTLATFRPQAKRLQKKLQEQMCVLNSNASEYNKEDWR